MAPHMRRMSKEVAGPPSPTPSLIEVKTETRLVLKSFLRKVLAVAPGERPGRIGGEYHDPNIFSAQQKERPKKEESGWDSLDEKISAAEEKKHGIKTLMKKRLRPRPSASGSTKKDTGNHQAQNGLVDKPGQQVPPHRGAASPVFNFNVEEGKSSASEEEGERKTDEKKKKKNILKFWKKSLKKEEPRPPRPTSLSININKDAQPEKPLLSPTHPPEFYDGVAEKLDRIAQRTVKKKSPTKPEVTESKEKTKKDKEAIIQELVQILTMEGDYINEKINADPFLRSSLKRLSYPSFAKLLDTCAIETDSPIMPVPESPTLRRVAITMEMTRRVVTATGATHRVEGYAERYMENFAPWVKKQGGWETIVQMEPQEFD